MNNSVIPIAEKGIVFKIAKYRVAVSRIFGLVVLLLLMFTGHSFSQDGLTDFLLEDNRAVFTFDMQPRTIMGADVYKRQ